MSKAKVKSIVMRDYYRITLLAGFVFVGSVFLASICFADNLLTNSGFESGDKTGWTDYSGSGAITTLNARSEIYSLQLTGDSDRWRNVSQEIAVTEGLTYEVSTWLKVENITTGKYNALLNWYDSNGERVIGTGGWIGSTDANTEYSRLHRSFIAPVGAVIAKLILQGSKADGFGYFDDVQMHLVTLETIAAGNLLTNWGFESGDKLGWNDNQGVADISLNPFSETYALQVMGDPNRWVKIRQEIPVAEGLTYEASLWLKIENITTGLYVALVRWYNADEAEIGTQKWIGSKGVNTGEYVNLSNSFVAPAGAVTAQFILQANQADGSGYYDDLKFRQLPEVMVYTVDQNATPGAQVTTTFNHNAGGRGITSYYGYYVTEFPSLNDYGLIAGRTDVANSPDPMVKGASSGQAAVWENGITKNISRSECRDRDGDGIADASACGSRALAISNLGKAVGSAHVNRAGSNSYFEQNTSWWPDSAGEYNGFGSSEFFYAASQSQIEDINSQSSIAGTGITPGGGGPQDGMAHGLVKINGYDDYIGIQYQQSRAHALNENNLVTGAIIWNDTDDYSYGVPRSLKAYTWLSGKLNVVQDGITDPEHISEGFDVNDSGLVIGLMGWSNDIRAFKWASPNGSLEDLGTLGGSQSVARSVNNAGTVVGWANVSDGDKHAFVYENGMMHDLNDYASGARGFVIVDAYSINEIGQILVRAHNALTNENQYWLLTNPESLPSSPPELPPAAVEVVSMGAFGGEQQDLPIKIMVDGEGNTISVGYYNKGAYSRGSDPAIDFNPSTSEDIINSGSEGAYIQKLDSDGNYLWTKLLPGTRMGSSTRITDLFVEPDGAFHLVGRKDSFGFLDINPDPDVRESLSKSWRDTNVSFRASYSSNGELISSALLPGFAWIPPSPVGVTVDDARNIYVVYKKSSRRWGGDADFDPGDGVANAPLSFGRAAIVITKTSRNSSDIEKLEWVKTMNSAESGYGDNYTFIWDLSIAAPAIAGEGPMVAFAYKGAMDFQIFDSNSGLTGESQIVDVGRDSTAGGFIRMTESGEPGVLWIAPKDYYSAKIVRSGNHFGLLLGNTHLVHGVAAEAGHNHFDRTLKGNNTGITISQQGDVYSSGSFQNLINFDSTGYDIQGNVPGSSAFVTKINANGSYAWTFSHQGDGYTSVVVDHFDNITAIGKVSRSLIDPNGNIIRVRGQTDVLVTRMVPVDNIGGHFSGGGGHVPGFAPDFVVRVTPYSKVINAGDSTSYTVQLESFKGLTGAVTFTFLTPDSSVSGSFSNPSVVLAPDDITTVSLTVSTSFNTSGGSHEFEVIAVDGDGVISKTAMAKLYVHQLSDLVIDTVTSPSDVRSGADLTLSYTVMNQGADNVHTPFTNKIYLSTDPVITTTDVYLGQFDQVISLVVGANDTASHIVTIPSNLAAGNYYIGVIADADTTVTETNESNNSKGNAINIVASDVDAEITAVTASVSSIARGYRMTLKADLNNLGSDTITGDALVIEYYLSTDSVVTQQDILLGSTTATTLVGGTSLVVSIGSTITIAAGTYYLGAIIDPGNQITETDESNNAMLNPAPITINDNADLTISALSGPSVSEPEGRLNINFTATNLGSVDATGRIYYKIVIADNAKINAANTLWYEYGYINSLVANSSRKVSRTITLPAGVAQGDYYLGVIIDSTTRYYRGYRHIEADESNNTRSQPLEVLPTL